MHSDLTTLAAAVLPLAQAEGAVFWGAVLIVILIIAFVAVIYVRRLMSHDEDFHGEGFTLGDLRQLHKAGQLSDEEFDKAKSLLVAGLQKAQNKQTPPKPQPLDLKPETPGDPRGT
jgi:hypothetical protein